MHPYDILAMNGASAALAISPVPVAEHVGAVRVGKLDGDFVVNPPEEEHEKLEMDLIVSGSKDAILMVECGADNVTEAEVLDALDIAHAEIKKLVGAMEELAAKAGKEKISVEAPITRRGPGRARSAARHGNAIDEATSVPEKLARQEAIEAIKDAVARRSTRPTPATRRPTPPARRGLAGLRHRSRRTTIRKRDRRRQEASRRSRPGRDPSDRDRGRHLPARARLGAVHPR